MRDAIGGSVSITIVVLFIVVALGYMAFNVNYTKAFRMKNKIVSTYEEFNGDCSSSTCQRVITNYALDIGYDPDTLKCPDGNSSPQPKYYCLIAHDVYNESYESNSNNCRDGRVCDKKKGQYYTVITKVNIEIPIIKNLMNIRAFQVSGDTKALYK